MNIRKIRKYEVFSVIFTFILGTLLHFTYEWLGGNKIVAVFSSINESTWEHLKLVFFPMLLTTILGYFYLGKEVKNFICSKTIGIIVSILFIIIFYYTYTGVIGYNITFFDVGSFFVSVMLGEFISYLLMINKFKCNNTISLIILITIFICFIVFTFKTPNIGIFKDPLSGQYSI